MRTKIFVCSNSGINYTSHSNNISALPVIIKFNEEEEYVDYLDAISEAYFNRVKHSEYKPSIIPIDKERLLDYINNAIHAKYDQIVFILSSKEFIDTIDIINDAIKDFTIPINIIETNAICYPLASMAIEADRLLNKLGVDIETVENKIKLMNKQYNIYIYSSNKDAKTVNASMKFADESILPSEGGDIYTFNGELNKMDKKLKLKFDDMISMFNKDIGNDDVIPFILCNSKDSLYNDLLEVELLKIFGNLKYIKKFPIPSGIGNKFGSYSCAIGYTKFEKD
ncbi:MAG: DegV family protein [Acholeplasmatales bacterium]|nr:DegV family protein [Acholeplasmatales bacterium]